MAGHLFPECRPTHGGLSILMTRSSPVIRDGRSTEHLADDPSPAGCEHRLLNFSLPTERAQDFLRTSKRLLSSAEQIKENRLVLVAPYALLRRLAVLPGTRSSPLLLRVLRLLRFDNTLLKATAGYPCWPAVQLCMFLPVT